MARTPHGPGTPVAARPLGAVDSAWAGNEACYLLLDVAPPPVEDVRRAVRGVLLPGAPWSRRTDAVGGTWVPVPAADHAAWVTSLVVPGPAVHGDLEAARRLVARPLEGRPFLAVVTEDALLVRFDHVVGDGVSMQSLVRRLLGAQEAPAHSWSAAQVERAVIRRVLRRPLAAAATVASYRRPETEAYVPAAEALTGSASTLVSARVDGAFTGRLLALRDAHWPGAPFSAVLLVALRRALARTLPRPARPGAEMLIDLRRYLGDDAPALNNLARGLYLCPEDDDDPAEVGRVVRRELDRGAPLVSLAAAIAQQRLRPARAGEPRPAVVAAGGHGARIALSYLRGLGGELPAAWRPGSGLWTETSPNGPEGLTVVARDLGGTFSLDATCYPDVLAPEAVGAALHLVLEDLEVLLQPTRGTTAVAGVPESSTVPTSSRSAAA